MHHKISLLPLIAWFLPAIDACCENNKAPQGEPASGHLYAGGIPESGFLTLQAGKYTLPMDAASGWTIEKMFFGEHQFGLANGHYGTVLTPKGGKWWGTGHTEGGRERVHALELTVDGKPVAVRTGEYYLRQNKGQAFKKGDKLDYTVVVEAVPGETGDWKATKKAATQLREQFPPLE